MFRRVLKRSHEPQRLVHAPPHGQVIHRDLLHDPLVVDDKQPSQRDSSVFEQHSVLGADLLRPVAHDRYPHRPQTASFAFHHRPRQVRVLTIRRHRDHFRVQRFEFIRAIVKRRDLRRAHKRKVERVEEHHAILPEVIAQLHPAEIAVDARGRVELRRGLADLHLGRGVAHAIVRVVGEFARDGDG